MAYDPSLGKTSEDFRFIFTDREAIGKNKQKIRSHQDQYPRWAESFAKQSLKRSHLVNNY